MEKAVISDGLEKHESALSRQLGVNDVRTCQKTDADLTRAVSPSVLRKQLATLASVYERADAYNRAALEPLIRKALARAEEV